MKRVMIIGQPGSGKSTLARAVGERTGLPVFHIDKIHWREGWMERDKAEKTRLCLEVEAQELWVFEGGHSETWANRIARADTLVWLDRSLPLRLWRVVRRTVTGLGRTRPDMAAGCPERLDRLFGFASFIWKTRRTSRLRMAQLAAAAPPTCRVFRLSSDAEAGRFISDLRLR